MTSWQSPKPATPKTANTAKGIPLDEALKTALAAKGPDIFL